MALPKDYGLTLLKTMGLKQSLEIGRSSKANTPLPNLQARPGRLGLGAEKLAASLKENQRFAIKEGRRVTIKSGLHRGMNGTVLRIEQEQVEVSLSPSNTVVRVGLDKLVLFQFREGAVEASDSQQQSSQTQWVCQGLVVRVIDKRSKYYMLKGTVQPAPSSKLWAVRLQCGKTRKFSRKQLQTVIPKEGQRGRVVKGREQGGWGHVIERRMKEGSVVIQLEEKILELGLDEVCLFE